MWKAFSLAAAMVAVMPGLAGALELKNVRPTYAYLGAVRADSKYLAGDVVCLMFDIEGLKVEGKISKARYLIGYDLVDSSNKSIYAKETPQENLLTLGGGSVPGVMTVNILPKQQAGSYKIKLKVTDRIAKKSKEASYAFEIMAPGLGFVLVQAPAFGVPGILYETKFALVNMGLDKKGLPKTDVTMRVLDAAGKQVAEPIVHKFPRDLPGEGDFKKDNFIGLHFPVFPNRSGQFTISVSADDKIAGKKVELRFLLTVLDLSQFKSAAVESK
jgi:hypothetical protein